MINQKSNHLKLESDRAIQSEDQDELGFAEIAKKIAPSIINATNGDGMVVGIEGAWGSGKTSLLNFLEKAILSSEEDELHVITLAPWLSGDLQSLTHSLLIQISAFFPDDEILENTELKEKLKRYSTLASRGLASLLTAGGTIVPGLGIAGATAALGAEALENWSLQPSIADLKLEISESLRKSSKRFVIILDDLDRLEPAQIAEVVRLIRSVADFPNTAYLVCYDHKVVAHALETGLSVEDGELFLQKIIQLTFSMPAPEPFDLRQLLNKRILDFYKAIEGKLPSENITDELSAIVDSEGRGISLPRQVKLILNGIKFSYTAIRNEIAFSDLCRIQIIKVVDPQLYRWIENYLAQRSVVTTSNARVSKSERVQMGKELKIILPGDDISSSTIWPLSSWVPGVKYSDKPEDCIFQHTDAARIQKTIEGKLIGSPIHYRLYFAMAVPKTIMPDDQFSALRSLATEKHEELTSELISHAKKRRPIGGSWFAHVLDRLDEAFMKTLKTDEFTGWLIAVANAMDGVLKHDNERFSFSTTSDKAEQFFLESISELRKRDPQLVTKVLDDVFSKSSSLNWLVGEVIRAELWNHGIVGDRAKHTSSCHLTFAEVEKYREVLKKRISDSSFKSTIRNLPDLARFLYGWKDLSGKRVVRSWAKKNTQTDDQLLKFLLEIRNWSMSDHVYWRLDRESVELFLNWKNVEHRLDALAQKDLSEAQAEKLTMVMEAIELGSDR